MPVAHRNPQREPAATPDERVAPILPRHPGHAALLALQRTAGNQATTALIRHRIDRKPIEAPAIEVSPSIFTLPRGVLPTEFIARQIQHLIDLEQEYWESYERAVHQFQNTAQFGDDAAPPDDLASVFAGCLEGAVDTFVAVELGAFPFLASLAASLKETSFNVIGEINDRGRGTADARIVGFVNDVLDTIGNERLAGVTRLQNGIPAAQKGYWELDPLEPELGEPGANGIVVGPFADCLRTLQREVRAMQARLPESAWFQQRLSERFVDTGGRSYPISRGGRPSGTLHLDVKCTTADGERFSLADCDEQWTLFTSAPNPGKVATSLAESLHKQGKRVVDTQLTKWVHVWVIHEQDGLDDHHRGTITFESPSEYDVSYSEHRFVVDAWKASQERVAAVDKLDGATH